MESQSSPGAPPHIQLDQTSDPDVYRRLVDAVFADQRVTQTPSRASHVMLRVQITDELITATVDGFLATHERLEIRAG